MKEKLQPRGKHPYVSGESNSPIQCARDYVRESVQAPALLSSIPDSIKGKIRHSDKWIAQFKRVGDLLVYLKRFDGKRDESTYMVMKQHDLLTFEDIVAKFERKFAHWASDCTRVSDFVIGEEYSAHDILILARNYDTRSGGMFVLESNGKPSHVIIKATLSGGHYPNRWIAKPTTLQYYMKSIAGKFGEHFKANKAIIENPGIPVVTFVRHTDAEPFIFRGIFNSQRIVEDESGKAFILELAGNTENEMVASASHIGDMLARAVAASTASTQNQRLARLSKATAKPTTLKVISRAYSRNPDVIAEVLFRAKGTCEGCSCAAPFLRRSDGSPYLEVHHRVPLANGGEDTITNALALCPNCHRERHFGIGDSAGAIRGQQMNDGDHISPNVTDVIDELRKLDEKIE